MICSLLRFLCLALLISAPLLSSGIANTCHAQSLELRSAEAVVPDSKDYFTEVWGAQRDFSTACHIGDDDFLFQLESAGGGVWTGQHFEALGPTAKILPIPQTGAPVVFQEDCHQLAIHRPIDAQRFRLLSYRVKTSQPSETSIRWSKDRNFAIRGAIAQNDALQIGEFSIKNPANTWLIKQFDLPKIAQANFPWTGNITGLDIQPSVFQSAPGSISFDWIRLIDPNSSPRFALSWSLNNRTLSNAESIVVYVDSDPRDYDGMPFYSSNSPEDTLDFLTGILPPGDYYFYSKLLSTDGVNTFELLRSNYSKRLRINGTPSLSFSRPSRTSGRGYSQDQRRDAWDMSQASDVLNFSSPLGASQALGRGFHDPKIEQGMFIAESDADPIGAGVSVDPHLLLPVSQPVDTTKYRYFCHRTQLDSSAINRSLDNQALNDAGFFARLVYADSSRNLFGSTGGHEVIEKSSNFLEGLVTYCIDLWDSSVVESGVPWRTLGQADVIRFDPLESRDSRLFAVDFAELYQENETEDGKYTIQFSSGDPEGEPLTISLYFDTDNEGFDGTLLTRFSQVTGGEKSYVWNTSTLPAGRYYVYLEVSDGTNVNRSYAEVSILVSNRNAFTQDKRAPCDFNGDGRSDFTVVRPNFGSSTATWLTLGSNSAALPHYFWGNPNTDLFIDRDSNGDARSELTVVRKTLPLHWIELFTQSSLSATTSWGVKGDIPLAADFDGDSKDENLVFRPAEGNWYAILSSGGVLVEQWGLPGDIPVAEDYDGDGLDDLAIWRPSLGLWAIALSTRGFSKLPQDTLFIQWGLPGDQPMPGDYTGDGKADLSVWRANSGTWFICTSEYNFNCAHARVTQLGLPGDFPITADFDADDQLDVSVFRPSTGNWYSLRSAHTNVLVQQWGLPGDLPMCISPLFTARFSS